MDLTQLCTRFVQDDSLSTVKKQKSPFTGQKVLKGTSEYDKTLQECQDNLYQSVSKSVKKTSIPSATESILPIIASKMTQDERRKFLSSIPSVGVAKKSKTNLEIERDGELLAFPEFKPYIYKTQTEMSLRPRIDFKRLARENEAFVLPVESYDIFLKYFKKGLPFPKEIEEFFVDLPPDDFYKKLMRISIKQKLKIPSFILSGIISKIDQQHAMKYFHEVLKQPFPESYISNNIINIEYLLISQPIKDNYLFMVLLSKVKSFQSKLLKTLITNYNDPVKLLLIYLAINKKPSSNKKYNALLERKLKNAKVEDIEKTIDLVLKSDFIINDSLIYLYIEKLISQGPSKESFNSIKILMEIVHSIENVKNELVIDLFQIVKAFFTEEIKHMIENGNYGYFLADIYAKGDWRKYDFLKIFMDEIGTNKSILKDFLFALDQYYSIEIKDLKKIIGSENSEFLQL